MNRDKYSEPRIELFIAYQFNVSNYSKPELYRLFPFNKHFFAVFTVHFAEVIAPKSPEAYLLERASTLSKFTLKPDKPFTCICCFRWWQRPQRQAQFPQSAKIDDLARDLTEINVNFLIVGTCHRVS